MSRYVVWDAAKETADIIDVSSDYDTKKLTVTVEQVGVKANAILHSLCGPYNNGNIVSPGEYEKQLAEAKHKEALHNQEAKLEAKVPVDWVAS